MSFNLECLRKCQEKHYNFDAERSFDTVIPQYDSTNPEFLKEMCYFGVDNTFWEGWMGYW